VPCLTAAAVQASPSENELHVLADRIESVRNNERLKIETVGRRQQLRQARDLVVCDVVEQ
jgi:hypothetical protein